MSRPKYVKLINSYLFWYNYFTKWIIRVETGNLFIKWVEFEFAYTLIRPESDTIQLIDMST